MNVSVVREKADLHMLKKTQTSKHPKFADSALQSLQVTIKVH